MAEMSSQSGSRSRRCCGCGPHGICKKCSCAAQKKGCSNCQPSKDGRCLNMGPPTIASPTISIATTTHMASILPSPSVSLSSSHSSTPSTPPLGPNLNPISNDSVPTIPAAVGNAPAIMPINNLPQQVP